MFFFLILIKLISYCDAERVVCYTTNWSQYRLGVGKFLPEHIDPFLCTHLIYSFVKLNDTQMIPIEWNDDSTDKMKGMYERTIDLKTKNPQLKILLAIGGANFDNNKLVEIVKSDEKLKLFAENCVKFLKKRNFDGLDVDWEYPVGYKNEFSKLIKELRNAFGNDLLLTAAVAASKENIDACYDVPDIASKLDFLNVMSYDYHGSWEKQTGHVAPLYPRDSEGNEQKLYNVDFTISYYIQKGYPADKINLGFACYGKSFTLNDTKLIRLGSLVNGGGLPGNYTQEKGTLSYYEVCERLNDGWTEEWDNEHKVPYAYKGDQCVGYENMKSLREKVDYARAKNLGGVMFWSLDMDDFTGSVCGQGKYPIVSSVKKMYLSQEPKDKNKKINECFNGDGYYVDLRDECKNFYICENTIMPSFRIQKFTCPQNTLFDKKLVACNFKEAVSCN